MSNSKDRPYKGTRFEYFPDEYIVFDLETTGVNLFKDKIIEIGAIKIKNNEIIDKFETLVNPNMPIPHKATSINHITDEMVKDAPSFDEIAYKLYDFLKDSILAGYNIDSFDICLLYDAYEKLGIKLTNNFVDILNMAKKILPEIENYKLEENIVPYYNIDVLQTHRAIPDCITEYKVFNELKIDSVNKRHFNKKIKQKKNITKDLSYFKFPNIKLDEFEIDQITFENKKFIITGETEQRDGKQFENFIKNNNGIVTPFRKERNLPVIDYLFVGLQDPDRCNDKINFITQKITAVLEQKNNGSAVKIYDLRQFENYIDNEKIYNEDELITFFEKHINPAYLKLSKLEIKNNKSGYKSIMIISEPTVWRFGDTQEKLFAKFNIVDKNNYIAFPSSTKKILNKHNLHYYTVKSDAWLRIPINEFFYFSKKAIKEIINQLFIRAFNYPSFGCCGKYKECTEKGYCVHDDLIYTNVACQYKKLIDNSNKESDNESK